MIELGFVLSEGCVLHIGDPHGCYIQCMHAWKVFMHFLASNITCRSCETVFGACSRQVSLWLYFSVFTARGKHWVLCFLEMLRHSPLPHAAKSAQVAPARFYSACWHLQIVGSTWSRELHGPPFCTLWAWAHEHVPLFSVCMYEVKFRLANFISVCCLWCASYHEHYLIYVTLNYPTHR